MEILAITAPIFIILGLIVGMYGMIADDDEAITTSIIIFSIGIILFAILLFTKATKNFESSKYDCKTEIRSEVVNGNVVNTDTVYIFKRK